MTGPTHRQFSIAFGLVVLMLLYTFGITEINYYLAIPIVLMTSKWGALFPDMDHTWENVADKTIVKRIINIFIHVTGGKHRSWQTHSIDICAYSTIGSYILPNVLFNLGKISQTNKEVMTLLFLSFCSGWISHEFSDMLNGTGVRLVCFMKFKVALVPKKIGKLRFNTGNEWEAFVYKIIKIINIILGVVTLIYPLYVCGYINFLFDMLERR